MSELGTAVQWSEQSIGAGIQIPPQIEESEEPTFIPDRYEVLLDQFTRIPKHSFNIIAGNTGSGKTNLLKHIIYQNSELFNRIYLLCPTADQDMYQNMLPENWIFNDPDEGTLLKIKEEQTKNPRRSLCLIIDDCIGSKIDLSKSNCLKKFASGGRHLNITTFLLVQDLKSCSTIARANAKLLYLTGVKEYSIKTAFELCRKGFTSVNEFRNFHNQITDNFGVIRLNLTNDFPYPYLVCTVPLCHKIRFIKQKRQ